MNSHEIRKMRARYRSEDCLSGTVVGTMHIGGVVGEVLGDDELFHTLYDCVCKCGAVHTVAGCMLKSGISQSCGCNSSSVCESHVMTYLSENGYRYEFQKTFSNLTGVGGKCLSYDFAVYRSDGSVLCLIECQGEQHYRPVKWFGGNFRFEVQQEHDSRKREYAGNHGIRLVEVTYKCRTYDDISSYLDEVFAGFNI